MNPLDIRYSIQFSNGNYTIFRNTLPPVSFSAYGAIFSALEPYILIGQREALTLLNFSQCSSPIAASAGELIVAIIAMNTVNNQICSGTDGLEERVSALEDKILSLRRVLDDEFLEGWLNGLGDEMGKIKTQNVVQDLRMNGIEANINTNTQDITALTTRINNLKGDPNKSDIYNALYEGFPPVTTDIIPETLDRHTQEINGLNARLSSLENMDEVKCFVKLQTERLVPPNTDLQLQFDGIEIDPDDLHADGGNRINIPRNGAYLFNGTIKTEFKDGNYHQRRVQLGREDSSGLIRVLYTTEKGIAEGAISDIFFSGATYAETGDSLFITVSHKGTSEMSILPGSTFSVSSI